MIVVFYEDNEQFVVRALDGVEQRWQEEVKKQHLNIWLKQAADAQAAPTGHAAFGCAGNSAGATHHHAAEPDKADAAARHGSKRVDR